MTSILVFIKLEDSNFCAFRLAPLTRNIFGHSYCLNCNYSGILLLQSPLGHKNLVELTGWLYCWGRLKFHDLRAVYTVHRTHHTVLVNKQPECG